MAALMWRPNDPFGEFLQRWWDLAAGNAWPQLVGNIPPGQPVMGRFPVNVYEDGANYYLTAMLPGIAPETLEVKTEGNVLTIAGSSQPHIPEGAQALVQEIGPVQFRRQFTLGAGIDPDRISAHYEQGILRLVVAKAAHSRARRIPVASSRTEQAVTAA